MSPLQPISQVVQTPQELERKKRNGTARQVRQEKNSFFLVFCFLTFGIDRLGRIPRHQWKERLKISKLAKIAKLRKFTDVCIVGGGGKFVPPPYRHIFVSFQQITFKLSTLLI